MGLHTTAAGTLSDALLAIAKDAANQFSPAEREALASTAATTNTCLRYGWHFELGSTPLRTQNSNKAKSEFRPLGDPGDSRTL